jgi:hypothetical protein
MSNMTQGRDAETNTAQRPNTQTKISNAAGLCAGSSIMTLEGALPVEFLSPGDRIITRDSGVATLRDIKITTVKMRPVTIKPGTLGVDRPDAPITMAPGQRVLIRDWRAKALYGQAQALVPAERLIDGEYIAQASKAVETQIITLIFDAPHVIYVNGMELAAGQNAKQELPALV